jgi:tetratricopeptide (TPR) repeat protein
MRERLLVPIILILGLALYFPTLTVGTFILDDANVIDQAVRLSKRSFFERFLYGGDIIYYRPILMLSYLADIVLWDLRPSFMHLANILLHVANTLLVYVNVRIFYKKSSRIALIPFCAALLFLVHPINTESISWISGRTDALAAFFSLIAIYLVFKSTISKKLYLLWIASAFLLLGALSKEVAVFIFPGTVLFLLLLRGDKSNYFAGSTFYWRVCAAIPFVLGAIGYVFLRSASFKHLDNGVLLVTDINSYKSLTSLLIQGFTDLGFYTKKLFIPQPLSYAIDYVSPAYFWLGLTAFILIIFVTLMRNYLSGLVLLIALTIFPALLNALHKIAWTPYAERYLYIPSAFLCIALALPMSTNDKIIQNLQKAIILILICFFIPTTVIRNQLWAKPLELTRLTHQQNPNNPTVWGMYAVMLANQKHYDDARLEFNKILTKHPGHFYALESLASMELYIDDPEAARESLDRFFGRELTPNNKILAVMLETNQKRLLKTDNTLQRNLIRREIIQTFVALYERTKKTDYLFQATEMAMQNGDLENASHYLEKLKNQDVNDHDVVVQTTELIGKLKEIEQKKDN